MVIQMLEENLALMNILRDIVETKAMLLAGQRRTIPHASRKERKHCPDPTFRIIA
ncbi:hypothetical protein SB748_25140 [Rhizobium sp. SIMBA_035]